MTTSTIDSLPTIALDELISRGSLLTRLDRKYALTSADAGMAVDLVDADTTRVLQVEGVTNLGYSSTSLDTPELDTFLLAARRRRRRFKGRSRTYESNGTNFLEVKTRFRDRTVKHRLAGDHLIGTGLTGEGTDFVAETLRAAGVRNAPVDSLSASLRVDSRRVTLLHERTQARVTIDSGLAWWDVRTGGWLSRPELAIIESKSSGRPAGMDRLLWSLGHRPDRISKTPQR